MGHKKQALEMRHEMYRKGLNDLIDYVNKELPVKDVTMVEIGAYKGESTEIFAKRFKHVITIDPFLNNYDINDPACKAMLLEDVYNIFKSNVSRHTNITHIKKKSVEAIKEIGLEDIGFVYIDGIHTYNGVLEDIRLYREVIKNGFIAGHDFHDNWKGVKRAVKESLGTPDELFCDTSWIKKIN